MAKRYTLKDLRTARGWKREKVAAELDVSITTVANLERGVHQPRMQLARRIADLFEVAIDQIEWGATSAPKAKAA